MKNLERDLTNFLNQGKLAPSRIICQNAFAFRSGYCLNTLAFHSKKPLTISCKHLRTVRNQKTTN